MVERNDERYLPRSGGLTVWICGISGDIRNAYGSYTTRPPYYAGENGSWSGWGPLHSYIFVGDSICVESDMGNILSETVEVLESLRRSLFAGIVSVAIKRD